MAKIFWVVCPNCSNKFYAANDDYRHLERKLMCPFCEERFLDKDAAEVIDSN